MSLDIVDWLDAEGTPEAHAARDEIERLRKSLVIETSSVEKMAAAHWSYVEQVLMAHGVEEHIIDVCGVHYKTAFVHGWKHCAEKCDD